MGWQQVFLPGGGGGPAFTDAFSLGIKVEDTIATPTDLEAFLINLAQSDTNADLSETVQLGFPAGNFGDSSSTPTDLNSFLMRIWLSASAGAGVTNPANADGANNGAVATVSTAVAGSATETLTSTLGANVPSGASIASAIYRGWFNSVNNLVTSTGTIIMHSLSALFADVVMFTNSAFNTTINRLDGSFTFDLVAAGIDTLAKLQSCQVLHRTTDAAAGVTPHVLTVDAGCIELAAAFV